jgi:hypothetical protein
VNQHLGFPSLLDRVLSFVVTTPMLEEETSSRDASTKGKGASRPRRRENGALPGREGPRATPPWACDTGRGAPRILTVTFYGS